MYIENGLQVVSCTLSALLNSSNKENISFPLDGELRIPEYQRPYVWGEKQINKLLDDWIEYKKVEKDEELLKEFFQKVTIKDIYPKRLNPWPNTHFYAFIASK